MSKVLGLLQKQLTREEMKRLNVVPYPDRVTLLATMTMKTAPTPYEVWGMAEELAHMADMFCKKEGITEVLIGGANYLTPFLAHELMARGLKPVFVWMERRLKGYRLNKSGNQHGDYEYIVSGLVKPYSDEDVKLVYQMED